MTARATGEDILGPAATPSSPDRPPEHDGRHRAKPKQPSQKPAASPRPAKPAKPAGVDTGASPLALDGWLEFNRIKWGVQPHRINIGGEDHTKAGLEAVVYLNKRGKVVNPKRNAYLPVRFRSTPTILSYRAMHQWLDLSGELAEETRRLGLSNTLNLPPNVADIRAWQWAGFRTSVRYTFVIEFPFDQQDTDKSLGRIQRKAEREGFRCDLTTNMHDVMSCLADTEQRQGFSHGLTVTDLELAQSLLGEDVFRTHMCYAPNGEPASCTIALCIPGAPAIGWIGGTRTEYLRAGPAQFLEFFAIDDLTAAGASEYDTCGANIPTVAYAMAGCVGVLRRYYTFEGYVLRRLAKWSKGWWEFLQKGRSD